MGDSSIFLIGAATVGIVCLVLCVAALLQARRARDINFERNEKVTRLTEQVTGLDMKLSRMELKNAQLEQRMDMDKLDKIQQAMESKALPSASPDCP